MNVMKLHLKFFLFCYFVSTSFVHAGLTLEDCYDLALANSETMTIAELRALIEEDRTREVWGMALPQLSAGADFITKGDAKHLHHHDRTKNARVSLIIPIYNFGGARHSINAQEKREESAIIDIERTQQEILYATNQAFFILLEFQKIEKILNESIQTLNHQLHITQDFKNQGLVHENELLVLEVEISLMHQELLQAQNGIALAMAKLNRLIGYDLDCLIVVEDILDPPNVEENLHQILCEARINHPSLKSLQAQIEAAQYTHRAEKGKLYPTIYGYSNYSTTNDYALPYRHGLDAGIGMQISLYDGGSTWAKLKRLKKEVAELEQKYLAQEKNIELNVRSAFLNVESAAHKIPVSLRGIQLAERNLKITQDHYSEGLITNVDVINDEERLLKSRYNYYQTLYQFHRAKADLAYAAGINVYKNQGCKNDEE